MPVETPDFGIDPALLAQFGQPPSQANGPAPMDVIGRALEALAASVPPGTPMNRTSFNDADLGDPAYQPEMPVPVADAGRTGALTALQQGAVTAEPVPGHLPPSTPRGQQAYPSPRHEAGIQRQYLLDDPSRPLQSNDVAGLQYREEQAGRTAHAAALQSAHDQVLSQQAHSQRLYQVEMDTAHDMETAQSLYQQQRKAIGVETDQEAQAWLQQYQVKAAEEPNTDRWFESRTSLGKALWALGMVFGSIHAGVTPGAQNVVLNMALSEIDKDVQLQKERLNRELQGLKMKGDIMEKRHTRLLTDAADDHSMFMGKLQALKQAYIARVAAPGNEGMQAGLAAADAWFAQEELKRASAKTAAGIQIREGELNRAHGYTLAKITDRRERAIAAMNDVRAYDLAAMAQQAAKDAASASFKQDLRGITPDLGAKMTGSPMGEHIQVHKEDYEKTSSLFRVANQRYHDLKLLHEAMQGSSFASRMLGEPELRAAAKRLQYTTAAEYGQTGHGLSDKDVSMMGAINVGYDPVGDVFDSWRFGRNADAIKKMVETEMRMMPEKVSQQASQYLDTNLVGDHAKILWAPQDLGGEAPPEQNAIQVFQGAGLAPVPKAPADLPDFERRKTLEGSSKMFEGRELPPYDKAKVGEFAAAAQGLEPDYIRKLAEKTLKDYSENRDPWAAPVKDYDLTTRLAVESEAQKAIKVSQEKIKTLNTFARQYGFHAGIIGHDAPTKDDVLKLMTQEVGLTDVSPGVLDTAVEKALKAYNEANGIWLRKNEE